MHPVGTRVRVTCKTPKYNGREGTIVNVNLETFEYHGKRPEIERPSHLEYGVNFRNHITSDQLPNARAEAWFLPTEISLIS